MKIGIIGQGYVGNSVFQIFKNFYDVFTYDIKENLSNSSLDEIKKTCEVIFICVPTPMNSDGSCDSSIVESVIKEFSKTKNKILINKSTVVPGTTSMFNKKYTNNKIIFNPEFLTERNAFDDFKNQERIIIGGPGLRLVL